VSFPDGLTLVTVHGQLDAANGKAEFVARQPLIGSAADAIVMPFTVPAVVDGNGEFTVDLPATDDPGWSPSGWAYAVRVTAGGASVRGTLQLDYQTTSVELADLLQVDGTAEQGVSYILVGRRGVAGGVAGLDADGDVIDATGAKVTSGSGGGAAPGSTVVSETSYGQTATAGTGTAYSRATHSHGTPPAPAAADISDATTVGKAVLTAADAAAARTAIGAETSGAAATAQTTAEAYADSAVATHSADTTGVHGITDTRALVVTTDTRLSDARTPTAHASTHADGGADEIAVDASQVSTGTVAIARLPTGTSGTTVALGNHTHTGVYQPLDADLTTIAGLTATTGNFMVAQSSAWASVGAATAKTAIGLGNVDNTADTAKPISTATQTALDGKVDTADYPGLIVLGPTDDIPGGTAAGTVIVRTAS
jgi:hypothetical protein